MSEQTIRPYSMQIFGLQDDFLGTLKPLSLESRGHVISPKIVLKNDGTTQLSFSIPQYYTAPQTGRREINPMWAVTRTNELLVNQRKIKVIFPQENAKEDIFEFVITSKKDSHTNGSLICDIQGESLAFRELGGTGYKLSLTLEDFLVEYNEWAEDPTNKEEPQMTINYWCDKVFKDSSWNYKICMDWSNYPEVTEERSNEKVYEIPYVDDWVINEKGQTVAASVQSVQEKMRAINCTESNRYNITQDIAETFGVYCKYVYDYDDEYRIIGRTVVFYNNFFAEKEENPFDINYPYQTSEVSRTVESADVVTKMFVRDIEDSTLLSGTISIAETSANKSGEDYILNFDYLKATGSISQEQYDFAKDFENEIALLNKTIKQTSKTIAASQNNLTQYKATAANADAGIAEANDIITNAQMARNALLGDDQTLRREKQTMIPKTNFNSVLGDRDKYICNFPDTGVFGASVKLYYHDILTTDDHRVPVDAECYDFIYDKAGDEFVTGITISSEAYTSPTLKLKTLEADYYYRPSLYYDKVIDLYTDVRERQTREKENAEKIAAMLEEQIELNAISLKDELQQKTDALNRFERVMGAAIREGFWQNDDYKDYGHKDIAEITINSVSGEPRLIWDTELFDGENTNVTKEGINVQDYYYPVAELDSEKMSAIWQAWENKENVFLCYDTVSIDTAGIADPKTFQTWAIGEEAGFNYLFLNDKNSSSINPRPYLVLNDCSALYAHIKSASKGATDSSADRTKLNLDGFRLAALKYQEVAVDSEGNEYTIDEITGDMAIDEWRVHAIYDTITEVELQIDERTCREAIKDKIITQFPERLKFGDLSNLVCMYPRIYFASEYLRTENAITLNQYVDRDGSVLAINREEYKDFSVLVRTKHDNISDIKGEDFFGWFITLKNKLFFDILTDNWQDFKFDLYYEISNACVSLYLDALEVMKSNAFPKISYSVNLSKVPIEISRQLYTQLNRIVKINDPELFLDEVTGYISEVELNLDAPWEDRITIKDYKTKFEDLFSSITASTAQLQSNGAAYDAAASAFSTTSSNGVVLNPNSLQRSINEFDFDYAFNQGNLTIDEVNGIWARSDAGVVAMRGGGIFTANERDPLSGNWLWNTGITPEGINASLITTGQLDTNLVKIFAGTDLALQLNSDGLFAYKHKDNPQDDDTVFDYNTYVVHNDNGLFFHDGDKGDQVEISWDGLVIWKDKSANQKMFYLDADTGRLMADDIRINKAYINELEFGSLTNQQTYVDVTADNGNIFTFNSQGISTPQSLTYTIQLFNVYDVEDIKVYSVDIEGNIVDLSNNDAVSLASIGDSIYQLSFYKDFMKEDIARNIRLMVKGKDSQGNDYVFTNDDSETGYNFTIYAAHEDTDIIFTNQAPAPNVYKIWVDTATNITYYSNTTENNGEISYEWVSTEPIWSSDMIQRTESGFTFTDHAFEVINEQIKLTADNIEVNVLEEMVMNLPGISSIIATQDTITTQVGKDGTAVDIQEDGVTIRKPIDPDSSQAENDAIYDVHISNTGLSIRRSEDEISNKIPISSFVKTQLSVENIRVAQPLAEGNAMTMRRDASGGMIFAIEEKVTETKS